MLAAIAADTKPFNCISLFILISIFELTVRYLRCGKASSDPLCAITNIIDMNRYFLIVTLTLLSFVTDNYPRGWTKVGTEKFSGRKFEVYFFDYFSKVQEIEPDIQKYKGFQFTDKLENVHFQFPLYVFKTTKNDSLIYYVLRPNEEKRGTPFIFDIDIVKTKDEYDLNSLEDKKTYASNLIKTIDAKSCRGELVYEYNQIIQRNPDKDKIIGNGIPITDSVFIRVIPYKETKVQFFNSIQPEM